MKKLRLLNYGFAAIMAVLVAVMCWMGSVMYEAQQQRLHDAVVHTIDAAANVLREESVTNLSNLASTMSDSDFAARTAFAAGATSNTGRMREWFDEDKAIVQQQIADQNTKAAQNKGEGLVIQIDTTFMHKHEIVAKAAAAPAITKFNTAFSSRIKAEGIAISYKIHSQSPKDTVFHDDAYQYASPGFIIDFYHPTLYRVDFTIAAATIVKGMQAYIIISLFTLLLVTTAFVFMKRSYKLQLQMASFKESLFSNITHELKTPLSSLQIIMETAKGSSAAMPAQHIDFAATELTRMRLIVEKILAFGKMNSEQFALNKELVDMNEVIKEAIAVMQMNTAQSNAIINYTEIGNLILAGDKVLLINAIATIIDNGIKYNAATPQVTIQATNNSGTIEVRISDNGIGIDTAYRKKIFEPFFRIPMGNVHNVKGHGLGLSFVAQVVQLHKGTVVADANTNGSIFTITLPINAA